MLRAWFARSDAESPALYRAHGDPVVGRALRMLYNNPSHAWTVASLAAEVGISAPPWPAASTTWSANHR